MKSAQEWMAKLATDPEFHNDYGEVRQSDIAAIQRDAFEFGRVQGIQDCMGEFPGGSAPWHTLNARLVRMASKRPPTTHE